MRKFIIFLPALFISLSLSAQIDTLPKFTAIKKNGEIIISWVNNFKNITQLNIQRSKDSLKNFSTIHSVPSPNSKTYSYVDKTAKNDSGYYRIFILFEGTSYIFTPSKHLFNDTANIYSSVKITSGTEKSKINGKENPAVKEDKPQGTQKPIWVPSIFIYTGDDGNPVINLPNALTKKYSIVFKTENGTTLFKIPEIKETYLTLDKVNFLKSGWYYFELMEDGNLKEKNKFLITRDN